MGVWDMNALPFFFCFFGQVISDFHFLLLNEAHSARQIENQKGVWIGEGGDFFWSESTTFYYDLFGRGGRGRSSLIIVPRTGQLVNYR